MADSHSPVIVITRRSWISLIGVLLVQAQNAFNDNFLKFTLISLAAVVARGTTLGKLAPHLLSALIPIPFILFAPIAGYLSDRFAKNRVIFWCVIAQLGIFGMVILSFYLNYLPLGIVAFFLLSVQSTAFSPAKQGILKELVGSIRLATANGLMQMLTMIGILAGIWVGGNWFGTLLRNGSNPWSASMIPTLSITAIALIPISVRWIIQRTPEQSSEPFKKSIMFQHFHDLKELLSDPVLLRTVTGISYYWLVAFFIGVVIVNFGIAIHPDTSTGEAAKETSNIGLVIGIGMILGSVLVSFVSRKGINLKLVPIGGLGLTSGLLGAGLFSPGGLAFLISMSLIGFCGGFFLIPLTSFLQDRVEEETRGRMISAMALMTSLSGVLALGIGAVLTKCEIQAAKQVLVFVIPTLLITFLAMRLVRFSKTQEG